MYDLFRKPAGRNTGKHDYGELPYLKRSYRNQIEDIRAYYYRYPKRVDAGNLFGNLLVHIPRRWDMDDLRYLRFVEDMSNNISRAFGLTSTTYRGRVHESGVTLGDKTEEIVISVSNTLVLENADKQWRSLTPLRYLYHTRTDLTMPILNNTTPGKGHGVCTINIPLMALQYRYWLKYQEDTQDQAENIYRYVGRFLLPNAIESYLDIAFFNHLSRIAAGVGIPKHPTTHPFYLTDLSGRVGKLCERIIADQPRRMEDIEQVVYTTPMLVADNLWSVMQLPKDPVTRNNEWALQLARLPYVRYLVDTAIRVGSGDNHHLNQIYTSLVDANTDNVFNGVGSPEVVRQYRLQLRELIDKLEAKNIGWK